MTGDRCELVNDLELSDGYFERRPRRNLPGRFFEHNLVVPST